MSMYVGGVKPSASLENSVTALVLEGRMVHLREVLILWRRLNARQYFKRSCGNP